MSVSVVSMSDAELAKREPDWEQIDEGIRPIVRLLRRAGFATFASCSGGPWHGSNSGWVRMCGDHSEAERLLDWAKSSLNRKEGFYQVLHSLGRYVELRLTVWADNEMQGVHDRKLRAMLAGRRGAGGREGMNRTEWICSDCQRVHKHSPSMQRDFWERGPVERAVEALKSAREENCGLTPVGHGEYIGRLPPGGPYSIEASASFDVDPNHHRPRRVSP